MASAAMYGALPSPKSPPSVRLYVCMVIPNAWLNEQPLAGLGDVRHYEDSPMPWLRYFFPKDFDLREGDENQGPYYQYFDVQLQPVQDDSGVPPPAWAPNSYFRLSFTQAKHDPQKKVDVPGRMPDLSSPFPASAEDVTHENLPLFQEGCKEHLEQVLAFCKHVASFKPRIWRDAPPLVDLLRGVLMYLVSQAQVGMQLAREYALRDALADQEADRQAVRDAAAADLAAAQQEWQEQAAAQAETLKEALKKQAGEELATQLRNLAEEKDRLLSKVAAGEASMKKLQESETALERRVAQLESQLDSERADFSRTLTAKAKEAKEGAVEAQSAHEALLRARDCVLKALTAKNKAEVMQVALQAITATLPGANGYIAEVQAKDTAAADGATSGSAALELLHTTGATDGPDSPIDALMSKLDPVMLKSPLSMGVTSLEGKPPGFEDCHHNLALRYICATKGQDFLVGQQLVHPQGVSWSVVESGAAGHIPDVAQDKEVALLRPGAAAVGGASGSYLAVPILGSDGEVVGLLGVDTVNPVAAAGHHHAAAMPGDGPVILGEEDASFVAALAAVLSRCVAEEQAQVATLVDQVLSANRVVPAVATLTADPQKFADAKGGKALLKTAVSAIQAMTDTELDQFRSIDNPNDTTLAVLRTVLKAAGHTGSDGGSADLSWDQVKALITRDLLGKLSALDPDAAWAEWQHLVQGCLQPVLELEGGSDGDGSGGMTLEDVMESDKAGHPNGPSSSQDDEGVALSEPQGQVSKALGRWIVAVRKISAANELRRLAEARLARANAALLQALSDTAMTSKSGGGGGGGGAGKGSHALQELRSYRVPPKYTFLVLQAVLQLVGHTDDDCKHWGRMKTLTTYKLVKQLTELKPSKMQNKLVSHLRSSIRDIDDVDVRKESEATLALFRWLQQFLRCAETQQEQDKGK